MRTRLIWIVGILAIFGLAMLSSAGIVDAQKKFASAYYYFNHQLLLGLLPGVFLAYGLSKFKYKHFRKLSLLILFGALVLMTLVFVPQFGFGAKGAVRWLSIGGTTFQPAEILKLALVIYFAAWFGGRHDRLKNWAYGAAPFFILLGFVALLLALQPDIGTLIITGLIAIGMYFVAGIELKKFFAIIGLGVVALSLLIWVEPYRFQRLQTFLNPGQDLHGASYQVNQAKIAIGAGGLFGVGFGQSTQKTGFLPEVVGDSIFAIVAEELGLVGAMALIGLFVFLCLTLTQIANATDDAFGRLLVSGMNIWIMSQAFVNMLAISGLAPLTGIPLPFVSYGGTALITLLAGLGIVLNVAKK
ncbi:MAG: cell division protein FtsW [Candidatus Yanofskybacteria bacterium RIFCSPHIGHO2_02_FULL_50_12]|uniref:Probable peptidoglycan glycosyltransferase FtsW n=1 Tax=Candidatus Yanofskybacteria bacterium RIFCSPHIGHO2_02_FULL_50_12 TaxID=1802685 RepID=A0A1F8FWX2_9BACT|nr:MAG: cell division protein FtsW [Candidatus Yanofskybacteria bacterium RIFCSPHIGHO2_02_FULL_50_12]